MYKRWSALVVGGILLLGACGQEEAQPAEETTDVADHEMDKGDHNADGKAAEDEPESSSVDQAEPPEAASGEASPLLAQGETTSYIFNEVGEFPIHCEPHPNMTMKVIVEEGASSSGEAAVEIVDFAYAEAELTVAPGTVVTWTNQDTVEHNVFFE
ncbi:plastocyanin/azurin family copper-binding protein [Planococcus shenhongbingii]|uniref:Plastocyanin/azurin family copper-binding protein n=1 Tax=Planococcus shenhongbingii TaxID=3058398 RepID=A0ABT8NCV3_9BACL|nr:plastocyanin/azurin family copper-binding protein [Planococcus sp. N017]MDN7245726.1 plastocyanin/azurin family copper-binding protein [Planococcus sp. N017]